MGLLPVRRARTPLILQTEAAECGLACMAMVAAHHGHHVGLAALRESHSASLRGTSLTDLRRLATGLQLASRALRAELHHLASLRLPCILHWDFDHFVVLTAIGRRRLTLHDPVRGQTRMSLAEASTHFTGVVLELAPAAQFALRRQARGPSLRSIIGPVRALYGRVAQAAALALALEVLTLAGPLLMQWVVDEAVSDPDPHFVTALCQGFLVLTLLQSGLATLRAWLLATVGSTLNLQLAIHLFHHLVGLPMQWFAKRQASDVLSRFDSLKAIERTLTRGSLEAIVDGCMALTTLAAMVALAPGLAGLGLAAALAYAALRGALLVPTQRATEAEIEQSAREGNHLLETVRGMQSVKVLGMEGQRATHWQALATRRANAGLRREWLGTLRQAGHGVIFGVENIAALWLASRMVGSGSPGHALSVGMLLTFIAYKMQFTQRTVSFIDKATDFRMLALHRDRVGDVLQATPEEDTAGPGSRPTDFGASLAVRGLSFRYSENDPYIVKDLSFTIRAGESVAIVGPSGCGKSTLVKLMLGLLEPTQGSVEAGGHPLRRLGLRHYRSAVASVMQDDRIFAGSIVDNICHFEARPDRERAARCAHLACLDDDIARMPMGYDTLVGDMGAALSGGQLQRLLIARALYRRPRLLFLDEATSHLDLAREEAVNASIRALGLTRIIVAHRPQTIASADRVIRLDGRGGSDEP
jgi:ATP-binding cassette subfamily B protein RaxB